MSVIVPPIVSAEGRIGILTTSLTRFLALLVALLPISLRAETICELSLSNEPRSLALSLGRGQTDIRARLELTD